MKIHILTTGGTIDKFYFDAKDTFSVGDPQIGELLREANVTTEFDVRALMHKDSLDLTDGDREAIVAAVRDTPGDRFLITHGTDTMCETAHALAHEVEQLADVDHRLRRDPSPEFLREMQRRKQRGLFVRIARQDVVEALLRFRWELDLFRLVGEAVFCVWVVGVKVSHSYFQSKARFFQT